MVTSRTITPAGGAIGPVRVAGGRATLVIPAGAFPVPVQVTLADPKLTALRGAAGTGYRALTGVGIQIQENGVAYPGTSVKPLTLTMRSSSISPSSVVAQWNGRSFVTGADATIVRGIVTVRFDTHPDFAVLSPIPATAATAPIPRAARAQTGQPFLGRGILAAVLLVLGVGGVVIAVRSSRRAGT